MGRHGSSGRGRWLLVTAIVATFVFVPTAANADPSNYAGPIFGISTAPDGDLLVADFGQGILKVNGDAATLVTELPEVTDVTPAAGGTLYALVSGESGMKIFRIDRRGGAYELAELLAYEEENNPHPFVVESNPFDVEDLKHGGAIVADAAGNDLLEVGKHGTVKLAAVFPDGLVSTENAKLLFGCPAGPPDICNLPEMIPSESVPTSVEIGPDRDYYVGELRGFPAPTGASRIWRVRGGQRDQQCPSKFCTVAFDGFTSIIDLAFGPDGRLYVAQLDDASFLAVELGPAFMQGGSVHACDLVTKACEEVVSGVPILTSITFRNDGSLWGSVLALVPGPYL